MPDITFDVRQNLGVLSDAGKGWKKELNVISWNGRDAKLDIREWNSDRSKMKKGITLSKDEASVLYYLLSKIDNDSIIDKNLSSSSLSSFPENNDVPFD
ncbi:MAG: hypothetical protein IJZ94_02155 [Clostridia bacterium]|nr:hypothetical protein [Clostridia bacterium]